MQTALLTFAVAAALIVLLPGPDTLVVVRSLLREGRQHAALTVVGVLSGLAVWVAAAALGLSALLRASHDGYLALRIVGAGYLLWLGVQSLRARAGLTTGQPEVATAGGGRRLGLLGTGYGAGLATDLLNPKVGVFFVTFLPGFVPHGQPVGTTSLVLGGIFIVETAVYFAVLLLLAGRVTSWFNSPRVRRRLERATGLVLIGFGLRLGVES
jgi:threonine/homoserine/homoserine lactone efflux protein